MITIRFLLVIWLLFILAACASNDSRYRDNANLERPPEMPIDSQTAEKAPEDEVEQPKRRRGKGLKSDVFVVDGNPKALTVKRSFDEAWSLLNEAIQRNDLKVNDQDRSTGVYYVTYDGSGFFGKAASYFNDEVGKSIYLLKVEPEGDDIKVTASLAKREEQNTPKKDNEENTDAATPVVIRSDKSEDLIELLYDTLHDDLKEE